MIRERASRAISRIVLGRPEMLCAVAEWHQWPTRCALNALFMDRNHCRSAAAWECAQVPREITVVDRARQSGGL